MRGASRVGRCRLAAFGCLLLVAAALLAVGAWTARPAASGPRADTPLVYRLGEGGFPFSFVSVPDGVTVAADGSRVTLERRVLWTLGAEAPMYAGRFAPDPRSVERLDNGNSLIADRANRLVGEVRPDGTLAWSYTSEDDANLVWPFAATRLANGNTLITDRVAARVIEVTPDKRVVWQYGQTRRPGLPAGRLMDPYSATRLANGDTLICDNKEGNRVLQVRSSDYNAAADNFGFTAASIVWQYGEDGVVGVGFNQLRSPRTAQRLANGNTLICDAWAARIIEVTPGKQIVWQYGVTDTPNEGEPVDGMLNDTNAAVRMPGGDTVICDTANNRAIRVTPSGQLVWELGRSGPADTRLAEPRALDVLPDGRLVIADQGNHRLVEVGTRAGVQLETAPSDCGLLREKGFISLLWSADVPAGTGVELQWSADGGVWRSAGTGGSYSFPSGAAGWRLAFRVVFTSQDRMMRPALKALAVTYLRQKATPTPSSSATATPTSTPTATHSSSPTPHASNSSASPGTGSGDGSSGNGTGSSGSGSGGGSGGGSSGGGGGAKAGDGMLALVPSGPATGAGELPAGGTGDAGPVVSGSIIQEIEGEGGGARGSGGSGGVGGGAAAGVAAALLVLLGTPAGAAALRRRSLSAHDHGDRLGELQ